MNEDKEEKAGGLTVRSIDAIEQAEKYYQHCVTDDCSPKKDVIVEETTAEKQIVEPSYGKAEGNSITTDEIKQYFFCPYAYLYSFMGKVGASIEKDKKKRLYGRKQQHRKLEARY